MSKLECPKCGKSKKPWFDLCFECNDAEQQKPSCEICNVEVPEGHYLCKEHWRERQESKKKLAQIDYVKDKKIEEFKDKFEGKYHSPFGKMKSKSELLIAYFLHLNGIRVSYEASMDINGQNVRPDFIMEDDEGNTIILEHFGTQASNKEWKIKLYDNFCKEETKCYFIYTEEKDIFNLKDILGTKLNRTPLKRSRWK